MTPGWGVIPQPGRDFPILAHLLTEEGGVPAVAVKFGGKAHLIAHLLFEKLRRAAAPSHGVDGIVHEGVAVLRAKDLLYHLVKPASKADAERETVESGMNLTDLGELFAEVLIPELRELEAKVVVDVHRGFGSGFPDNHSPSRPGGVRIDRNLTVVMVELGIRRNRNFRQITVNTPHENHLM